jgi:polysaccharide deacetylase family protein (PEP-CTERM system associated)
MASTLQCAGAVISSPASRAPTESRVEHVFSVDVEEYFQVSAFDGVLDRSAWQGMPSRVEPAVDVLLELLGRHDALGTFFTLGWVADRHPALVRRIADAGHEVASHGWSHRRVSTITPAEFRDEVRRSKARIEEITGREVIGFRAPSFSIGPEQAWAFDVLIEEGYRYDSSVFPIRRPGYGDPDAPTAPYVITRPAGTILELPLATLDVLGVRLPAAGGGYLRHFPFGVIRAAFRANELRGSGAVFYVHPWELDIDQPRLAVSALTHFRHYAGLRRTRPRLQFLLREFRFTSVARQQALALSRSGRRAVATLPPDAGYPIGAVETRA